MYVRDGLVRGSYVMGRLSYYHPIFGWRDLSLIINTNNFSENFDSSISGNWTNYGGTWTAEAGEYSVDGGAGSKSIVNNSNYNNFIYEGDVMLSNNLTTSNAGLLFRVSNPQNGANSLNGYGVFLNAKDQRVDLVKFVNNTMVTVGTSPLAVDINKYYHIKINANGSNFMVYVNDLSIPKINATDTTYTSGLLGVRTDGTHAHFDNLFTVAQ